VWPCIYTLHRFGHVLRQRGPQLRIVVEECPHSRIIGALLAPLYPVVRVVTAAAFAQAAMDAIEEPDWSEEQCAEHAARIDAVFDAVLAHVPREGDTWLPRAVYDALSRQSSDAGVVNAVREAAAAAASRASSAAPSSAAVSSSAAASESSSAAASATPISSAAAPSSLAHGDGGASGALGDARDDNAPATAGRGQWEWKWDWDWEQR
jgi:hypothetical protein